MTSLEWQGSRVGGGGGGGSLPHNFTLPFAGDEIEPPRTRWETTRDGGGNFVSTPKSAGFRIICRSWTLWFRGGFFADSRFVPLPAAERTAQCDSRRLWRKPYLVKVFVAVTQRDCPAINSAGGGTEINAKIILQAVKVKLVRITYVDNVHSTINITYRKVSIWSLRIKGDLFGKSGIVFNFMVNNFFLFKVFSIQLKT